MDVHKESISIQVMNSAGKTVMECVISGNGVYQALAVGRHEFFIYGCYICLMKSADDEFISSIAPNVMQCLAKSSYFERLDDLLSPEDHSGTSENCDGTYRLWESV